MTIKSLLYIVNLFKRTEAELRTTEFLTGLTMLYNLPEKEHLEIQKEIHMLSHPAMDNFIPKDLVELDLLGVKFIFSKID